VSPWHAGRTARSACGLNSARKTHATMSPGEGGGPTVTPEGHWQGRPEVAVDDQIWQCQKKQIVQFAKPEYPVLTVSEQNRGMS
jgi:hypothetical protein